MARKSGVYRVEDGLVDDADNGLPVEDEGDGDAEHREEVRVIYCSIQGVDAPSWLVFD